MNVEIGTEASIFLFWKYLFQIFSIFSLQCGEPVRQTWLSYRPVRLHWPAETIPRKQFLGSLNLKRLQIWAQYSFVSLSEGGEGPVDLTKRGSVPHCAVLFTGKKKTPLPPQWERRAPLPNHIIYMTSSICADVSSP
jgi:hypothetical protein